MDQQPPPTLDPQPSKKNRKERKEWEEHEDDMLLSVLEIISNNQWTLISKQVPCRDAKSCKRRYRLLIDEKNTKKNKGESSPPFTTEDDSDSLNNFLSPLYIWQCPTSAEIKKT